MEAVAMAKGMLTAMQHKPRLLNCLLSRSSPSSSKNSVFFQGCVAALPSSFTTLKQQRGASSPSSPWSRRNFLVHASSTAGAVILSRIINYNALAADVSLCQWMEFSGLVIGQGVSSQSAKCEICHFLDGITLCSFGLHMKQVDMNTCSGGLWCVRWREAAEYWILRTWNHGNRHGS